MSDRERVDTSSAAVSVDVTMVATKRIPAPQVDVNPKEKKGTTIDGGPGVIEPLGGFIFVCNNDTMTEDFERHLFGLPQRYQDSVKAIQPGLPLFLYNYSTRCLHGVFEALSDGALNIEPEAWENKETRKIGRQVSRFPAQVRVGWREERPPLEEEKFRPLLYHYDGPKFRLELSVAEAEDLLKLFGTSSTQRTEKVQDDYGGEWERVKSKSKVTRVHRPPPTKRSSSPNPPAGRRRPGPLGSGSTSNGNTSQSTVSFSANGDYGRGRESRADIAQRWRSDSDSWSGSSSAEISTSSWASHDEDRPKKGKENGVIDVEANGVGVASEFHDHLDAIALKIYEHPNGTCENGSERDLRADSDELNTEPNGGRSSSSPRGESQPGSQSPSRPGFASYSAALKAGMTGAVTDLSNGDSLTSGGGVESGHTAVSRVPSSGNGALPSSADADLVGHGTRPGGGSKHSEAGGRRRVLTHLEGSVSGMQPILESHSVGEQRWHEKKDGKSSSGEEEGKKGESRQAWSNRKSTLAAKLAVAEGMSRMSEASYPVGKGASGHVSTSGQESAKDVTGPAEGDRVSSNHQGMPAVKDTADTANVAMEGAGKTVSWQGNGAVVLSRLHEPGSETSSSIPLPVFSVQSGPLYPDAANSNSEAGVHRSPQSRAISNVGQSSGQIGSPVTIAGFPPSQGQHARAHLQGPSTQPTRSGQELRRGQQYDPSKERDEKMQFRRTQSPSPDQAPPTIQQRQAGQSLMPLRIPTPPLQSQQHFLHPTLSPGLPNAHYRDRRSRPGAGAGDGGPHGMAYRPISRGPSDGEVAVQNGMFQGGGAVPSPPPLMQPISPFVANGQFPLPPPQLLANAEELHSEILEFAHSASPPAQARICAEAAVECVRDAVKKLWPSADVEVFGSYATGLCLLHSDVDVVVVDAPPPPETPETTSLFGARALAPLIRLLGTALGVYNWCENITTIESATMPVIKLHCKPPVCSVDNVSAHPPSVVKIDITIGGKKTGSAEANAAAQGSEAAAQVVNPKFEAASKIHNGTAAREYVIEKLHQQPALAPLVLLLKSYLQFKGLKDVYTGGLGSFSLTIMLVFYLERHSLRARRIFDAPSRVIVSCGTPQEAAPQAPASADAPASATSSHPLSADTPSLVSAPPGTDSSDSLDKESSCSSTNTASVSNRTSAVSSSSPTEDPSTIGAAAAGPVPTSMETSNGEPSMRQTGGIVEHLLASMHTIASPNLGTLLIGFLQLFGREIDFTQVRLVTKGNGGSGGLFYHDKMSRPVALTIDDPLRPGSNIGAGSFNMFHVQMAMQEMLHVLTRPQPPVASSERRVGMGPGRRRSLPLLDQLFRMPNSSPAPQ